MWSKRLSLGCLSVVVFLLEIRVSFAQLRNSTLWEQGTDDLDYFDANHYNVNGTRIVGGKRVKIRQVPWQIALYNNGAFICGGSIISVDWVLTAAHCVEGGGNFAIRAGSSFVRRGGQGRLARAVYITSSYTSNTYNTDIALIRVRTSFNITQYVRPIALARSNRRLPGKFFITGWGTRSENGGRALHLRGATVRLVSRNECRRRYQNLASITNYMICAAGPGKDACYGDSGGPLVRRHIQYGIVSFGIGCARSEYPAVHTNTRKLNRWIRRVIRRRGGKRPKFR